MEPIFSGARAERASSHTPPTRNRFEHLPSELLDKVCKPLNDRDLASLRGVDRRFRTRASEAVRSVHLRDVTKLGSVVTAFPKIQNIRLYSHEARGDELSVRDLQSLAHAPDLETLHFKNVSFGEAALHELRSTPHLRTLGFEDATLSESDLAYLRHTPALQQLECKNTAVPEDGLQHVRHVPQLRSLNLESADIHTKDLVYLSPLQQLTHLNLDINKSVDDDALAHIDKLRKLEMLDVAYTGIRGGGFTDLQNLELGTLRWNTSAFGDFEETVLYEVAELKSLEELRLGAGNLEFDKDDRFGLEPLRRLPKLRRLGIDSMDNVHDSDLLHLAQIDGLTDVDVANSTGFTRAGLEALLTNPSLREVNIRDTEFAPLAAELHARYPHCTFIGA